MTTEKDTEFDRIKRRILNNKWVAYVAITLLLASLALRFGNDVKSFFGEKSPREKSADAASPTYAPFISREQEVELKHIRMFLLYTEDNNRVVDEVHSALLQRGVSPFLGSPVGGYLCPYWGIGIPSEQFEAAAQTVRKLILRTASLNQRQPKRDLPVFTETQHEQATIYIYLCSYPVERR